MNYLYYGDNLDVLRRHIKDETVDLVYLDPPFNSSQDYNVLFSEHNGTGSKAQMKAFEDTWRWDEVAAKAYADTVEGGGKVADALRAFRTFLGGSDMLAYLSMMAPRLVELRRVLKPTGSIYLHCDPTASHYLKMLMDAVFGPSCFLNEIAWKRTSAHSSAKRFGPVHDVLLFYGRSGAYTWRAQYQPHDPKYIRSHYGRLDAAGRPHTLSDLTAAGVRKGSSGLPWRGFDPAKKGNHWKFTVENLEQLDRAGRIYWPSGTAWPRYIRYLDEVKGVPLQDVWTDLPPVNAKAAERDWATPPRNPKPCSSALSKPPAPQATSSSTRSAVAEPRWWLRRTWDASGSGSTSPPWLRRSSGTAWQIHSTARPCTGL